MHKFKEVEIWKRSKSFCSNIFALTSNISEGSSRLSNKDFSKFLQIPIGSGYDIETQLLMVSDLKFISKEVKNLGASTRGMKKEKTVIISMQACGRQASGN